MTIETKFNISDMVIVKHDNEKAKRQITGISIRGEHGQTPSYNVMCGSVDSWHFEYELERNDNCNKTIAGFKK